MKNIFDKEIQGTLSADRNFWCGGVTKIYHINKQYILIYRLSWQHQNSLQIRTLTTETSCDVEHCMEYPIAREFIGNVTNTSPSDPTHCRQS